jgi:hypothetical protein
MRNLSPGWEKGQPPAQSSAWPRKNEEKKRSEAGMDDARRATRAGVEVKYRGRMKYVKSKQTGRRGEKRIFLKH